MADERPHGRWAAIVTGSWDINCERSMLAPGMTWEQQEICWRAANSVQRATGERWI